MALEEQTFFDRYHGISVEKNDAGPERQRMRIPTVIPCLADDGTEPDPNELQRLERLHLHKVCPTLTYISWIPSAPHPPGTKPHNPLLKALREALDSLPPSILSSLNLSTDALTAGFPDAYSVYPPLLLLPSNTLSSTWTRLIATHSTTLTSVWSRIASALHCTHIALNSPIPPSNSSSSAHAHDAENILRSPVNLVPLHGSFGADPTPQTLAHPSPADLEDAFWVSARQNGIVQAWAPRYTMFSRGNVKEKARVLKFSGLFSTANTPVDMTAVDLYAGIGYFSFSYARGGCKRVLCWELNPWSVEGLLRGAKANGWSARVFTPSDIPSVSADEREWTNWRDAVVSGSEQFWVFAMSNCTAARILACLKPHLPPVRHVNLGLLPTARPSWGAAVGAVDERIGGWVHVHENVGLGEMDERREEVEGEFQRMADERGVECDAVVKVQHVERVKMYAPGVVHAVFDVHISGSQATLT